MDLSPSSPSHRPPGQRDGAVVIPCYNHGETLGEVISQLSKVIPSLPIVVVDDGSDQPIGPIPGVSVIRHASNRGKGAAMLTGAHFFHDMDYLVFVDADGQHPIPAIPALANALDGPPEADLVITERDFLHDRGIPFRHRVANIVLSIEFFCLFRRTFRDVTCGLRVARTKSFLAIDLRRKGYEVEIETITSMLRQGFVIRATPVQGVTYDGPSTVGRGFAITARLLFTMLAIRLFEPSIGSRKAA